MPYEGSMLDRALAALEAVGEPASLRELGEFLGMKTAKERNTLSCALGRAWKLKLVVRISTCSRCGHVIQCGQGKASLYELAPNFESRLAEVVTKQRGAQRANALRSHAINDPKHRRRAA